MISFNFNEKKAIELVLYLSNRIPDASVKKILKLLFYADVYHINNYGRPIIGNIYNALPQGPVNSKLYDLTKEKNNDFQVVGKQKRIITNRNANIEYFSRSDIEALDYSLKDYGNYSADKLSEMTHEHKAWIKARKHFSNNPPIDWFDLLNDENNNEEMKRELEFKATCLAF